MSEVNNPYVPQQAEVADTNADDLVSQLVKLFSLMGRIGRLRYFASLMLGLVVLLAGVAIEGRWFPHSAERSIPWSGLLMIPYLIFNIHLKIRRGHDMDWTGWSVFFAFIPAIGLIWMFKAGSQSSNRFGLPPPPNTTMVYICALSIPVMFVFLPSAISHRTLTTLAENVQMP